MNIVVIILSSGTDRLWKTVQIQISLLLRARSEHSDGSTLISISHPPFGLTSLLKKHFDVQKLRILEVCSSIIKWVLGVIFP